MDDSSSSSSPGSDHDHWSINTDNRLSRDHLESASADNLELHALNSCGEVSQNVNSSAELNRTYSQQDATKHITFRVLEVVFLSVIILILLALYLIPTFLFIYPPLDFTQFEQLFSSLVDFNGCAVQLPYTGQVCRQELSFMLSSEQDVHNISATNQEALERYGRTFFRELSSLDPSPECVVAIRLFVCLHYFQACDDSMAVLATETVCRDVRDRICVREWMEIDGFLGFSILPICEELPEGNSDFGIISSSTSCAVQSCERIDNITLLTNDNELNCSDFFYYNATLGVCRPMCGWKPHVTSMAVGVIIYISICVLLLFSGYNVLAAFTIQRQMLKFPVFYFVLISAESLILGIVISISFSIGESLTCRHPDYISNIQDTNKIVYCEIEILIISYLSQVISYSSLFYALTLLWSTAFPFKFRQAKASGRIKYFIVASLIITFTIPLSVLLLLKDGSFASNFLTPLCTARNSTHYYIVSTLHQSLLMWLGTSIFVVIIWIIFKELVLKKFGKAKYTMGAAEKAEVKLLVILIYFTIITILKVVTESFASSATPMLYLSAMFPYFDCESRGRDDSGMCQALLAQVQNPHLFNVSTALVVMLGFLPFFLFIFSTDFQAYLVLFQRMRKKLFSRTTNSTELSHRSNS